MIFYQIEYKMIFKSENTLTSTFYSSDFDRTWWRLFQKHVVYT